MKWVLGTTLMLAAGAVACGGPNYKFDPSPAPPWAGAPPASAEGATIEAVGRSPATVTPPRDLDLATRDAKKQVALLFESKVKASSNDWTLAVNTGDGNREVSVLSGELVVQTSVKVEASQVVAAYRDKETKSQLVHLRVDRVRWADTLRGRVKEAFASIASAHGAAKNHLSGGKPFEAYKKLNAAYATAASVEPDIIVLGLLDKKAGVQSKLREAKTGLDETSQALRSQACFKVSIGGPSAGELKGSVKTFLGEYGFRVASDCAHTVKIKASTGAKFVRKEPVGTRIEHIFAATGDLEMTEAGTPAISVRLNAGAHEKRDAKADMAKSGAEALSAATLARKFRAAFRRAFDTDSN